MKYPAMFFELVLLSLVAFVSRFGPDKLTTNCYLANATVVILFSYVLSFSVVVMRQIARELNIRIIW